MSRIRVLPDHVANQIAAGEVVDRPASVVKELVENALDAEARKVSVQLQAGGRELIAVEDDGIGMDPDDALLCFDRHATSKLKGSEDLDSIQTLGFRGEALPSIASVAKVTLRTRERTQQAGTEVQIRGGVLEKAAPIAWPGGTRMEIRSLFFNTPARRKFLRTEPTELRHVTGMITRLALSRPDVHFQCFHNERALLDLPAYPERLERIGQLYGSKLARSLTRLQSQDGGLSLEAYVGPLHDTKSGSEYQQAFINGRSVRSPILQAALQDAFHLVLPRGRLPILILYLSMPFDEVDVNVHPTKAEVRFHSPNDIRAFIGAAMQTHLGAGARGSLPQMNLGRDRSENIRIALDSVYPENPRGPGAQVPGGGAGAEPLPSPVARSEPLRQEAPPPAPSTKGLASSGLPVSDFSGEPAWLPRPLPARRAPEKISLSSLRYIGQLANTFLLLEDEQGLVIVDQHVAHERVRVEELLEGARTRRLLIQPLLVPQILEVSPAEGQALERGQESLLRLGFEIDPISANTVAVRSTPAALDLVDLEETVHHLAQRLQEEAGLALDPVELLEDALIMAACKGAIKAHDPLSPQQARSLLEKLDQARHPFSCPHGRPAYFRLPIHQIEREFGRLGFD